MLAPYSVFPYTTRNNTHKTKDNNKHPQQVKENNPHRVLVGRAEKPPLCCSLLLYIRAYSSHGEPPGAHATYAHLAEADFEKHIHNLVAPFTPPPSSRADPPTPRVLPVDKRQPAATTSVVSGAFDPGRQTSQYPSSPPMIHHHHIAHAMTQTSLQTVLCCEHCTPHAGLYFTVSNI